MIMTCALDCICAGARQLHNKTRAQRNTLKITV